MKIRKTTLIGKEEVDTVYDPVKKFYHLFVLKICLLDKIKLHKQKVCGRVSVRKLRLLSSIAV